MRKIKVFGVPSHQTKERTSGVDFARIVQPMKHLDGFNGEFEVEILKADVMDIKKPQEILNYWVRVCRKYDVIYFNYTANPWGFATMGAVAKHFDIPVVLDLDDSLWNIMSDNPAYDVYKRGSEGIGNFTSIVNAVDFVTVTNQYLKNVVTHETLKRHEQIKVIPNYLDLKLYSHRSKFKDDGQIRLLHFGSTTHFIDLQTEEFEKGIDMIMKEFPNVSLTTVGANIPAWKHKWGQRYEVAFGHTDIYKWIKEKFPKFMDETDILVTPLAENTYTRCKSFIKFLEGSSARKPGVWQDIRQYQEVVKEGVNGFLADSSKDWYEAIKKLILDATLRKKVGEEALKTVKKEYRIEKHIQEYADMFKEAVKG